MHLTFEMKQKKTNHDNGIDETSLFIGFIGTKVQRRSTVIETGGAFYLSLKVN